MITRKAAIGFILLAVIVFGISSYDYANRTILPDNVKQVTFDNPTSLHDFAAHDTGNATYTEKYRPPLIDFGAYTPLAMTAMIEIFTLVCYVILKRVEPAINAWAASEKERIRNEQGNP
jgi:hypothetical protein